MAVLEVNGLQKSFGRAKGAALPVLRDINLSMQEGEVLSVIGSSGSGKTTLLRCLNFLEKPDTGRICVKGQTLLDCARAETLKEKEIRRSRLHFGLVFQQFNLFPQYTVLKNVTLAEELLARRALREGGSYLGVSGRRAVQSALNDKAMRLLGQVGLADKKDAYPGQLSGGQQQRAALARAVAVRPAVLLLDEPLGSLDANLRPELRTEIRKLQRRLGITTICVTHDREEALAISDRIAVMREGRILQAGTPEELCRRPDSPFIARFVGASNLLPCTVEGADTQRAVAALDGGYSLTVPLNMPYSGPAVLAVRPGQLRLGGSGLPGQITLSSFLGDFTQYEVALSTGQSVLLNAYGTDTPCPPGTQVHVAFAAPDQVDLYRAEDGARLNG